MRITIKTPDGDDSFVVTDCFELRVSYHAPTNRIEVRGDGKWEGAVICSFTPVELSEKVTFLISEGNEFRA